MADNKIIVVDPYLDKEDQEDKEGKETSKPNKIVYPGHVPLEERRPERDPLPEGWRQEKRPDNLLYTYDENDKLICGAWNSNRRKYCRSTPIAGKNRCYFHGGPTPRGIKASRYKTGDYSRDMTEQLAKRFREAIADTELLSLRKDVALIDASIGERLSAMHEGEAAELWVKAKKTYKELLAALKRQDDLESTRLMSELGSILGHGYDNTLAMREVHKKQDLKRKIIESENKRMKDMRQMVSIEELMLVVGALVDSLKKHVHDVQALSAVSNDLRKLLQDRGYGDK